MTPIEAYQHRIKQSDISFGLIAIMVYFILCRYPSMCLVRRTFFMFSRFWFSGTLNNPGSCFSVEWSLISDYISDIMQHVSCSKALSESICFSFISVYVFLGAYYALIDFARALKRLSNYKHYVVISVDENLQKKNYFLKCKSILFCFFFKHNW